LVITIVCGEVINITVKTLYNEISMECYNI